MHGVGVVQAELAAEPLPQHVQRLAGGLERVGDDDRQVAGRAAELRLERLGDRPEVFGDRPAPRAIGLDLQPDEPLGASLDRDGGQVVEILAGKPRRRGRHANAANPAAALHRAAEHAELALARDRREVDDLQAEPQVGGVVAEPLHALVPRQPRQRQRHLEPEDLAGRPHDEPFDHTHHVVGLDERHLHVELRELRLPVGPQVFVAEALRHLHVAVEARHHQELLVELRRLGQGEERAVFEPAGHEVVAGPLGRALAEHGRFHVDEAELVEVVAHDLHDPAPQEHVLLHLRPPQVEPAMREPHLLARQIGGPRLEDGRLGLVEHLEAAAQHLDAPRGELGIGRPLRPGTHDAVDADHPFRPHGPGRGERLGRGVGADHDLGLAPPVAEIDEDHALVITNAVHPAAEGRFAANVGGTQFAAGVGSEHGGDAWG